MRDHLIFDRCKFYAELKCVKMLGLELSAATVPPCRRMFLSREKPIERGKQRLQVERELWSP